MAGAVLIPALALLGGSLCLWLGAEALVRGAATLGYRWGISSIVIGLTVVSVGTSAPELVVCILAALDGNPDLAMGNVMGSNLANVGLILGLAAIIRPVDVTGQVVRREIPWMLGVTFLVLPLIWNLELGRVEGTILALVLILYVGLLFRASRRQPAPELGDIVVRPEGGVVLPLAGVLGGALLLVAGGQGIVFGATQMADSLGVSHMIIGLSVVAVGTSLPELATTLVAAMRAEADLAVGNIVGSNIFNLTFVLGGTALVSPIAVSPGVLIREYPAVVFISLALLPVALGRRIRRVEGLLLLAFYTGAWAWLLRG